jgi:threonine synthase
MRAANLSCRECGTTQPLEDRYQCPQCGGSLEVRYDIRGIDTDWFDQAIPRQLGALWRFSELLPVEDSKSIVTLGEGNSPVIGGRKAADSMGLDIDLSYKLEMVSPSASFKDRPVSVAVSKARELGLDTIVVASTGNAAASASMYAARAGMKCVVCVPEGTEAQKTGQCVAHGAFVSCIRGTYSDAYQVARRAAELYRWCNVSTTYINPYTIEGDKTVAFEIWLQLGMRLPDWVVIPIGAGPLLAGVLKGFQELMKTGATDRVPRLAAVQAQSCSPIVEAFRQGRPHVSPWTHGTETEAHAIADPLTGYERDGNVTLRAIVESHGAAVAVTEPEIRAARVLLAANEGVSVEPASATVLAALPGLYRDVKVRPGDSVVCVLTGHGLKHPMGGGSAPSLVSRAEELYELVSRGA